MTDSRAPKAPSSAPDPSGLPTPPPGLKTQPRGGEGPCRDIESVTCRDIADLLAWARANGRVSYERVAKRADKGSYAAIRTVATLFNQRKGPWSGL